MNSLNFWEKNLDDIITNPLDSFSLKENLELKGTIDKQFFFNEESGFGIYLIETDIGMVKIKGTFVDSLEEGKSYVIGGFVTLYNKERQLQVLNYRPTIPYSKKGVTAYLGTLHGLKHTRANSIYAVFGNESIEILLTDPLRVSKNVSGIGQKSVLKWQQQLQEQKESEELTIELMGYGLRVKEIRNLHKTYGYNLVEKIKENPYFLAMEVKGYGFKRCDELAMNMGYKHDGIERVKAGILYAIEETCTREGHVYLTNEEFISEIDKLLTWSLTEAMIKEALAKYPNDDHVTVKFYTTYYTIPKSELYNKKSYTLTKVDEEIITNAVTELVINYKLVLEDNRVYLWDYYRYEITVVKELKRLNTRLEPEVVTKEMFTAYFNEYLEKNNILLEDKQYEAVVSIAYGFGGVHMLNGSAGCGKTFVLKIVRHMMEWLYKKEKKEAKFALFAPTGKAAKIASKAMAAKFSTIHKGLVFKPGKGFEFNLLNPLKETILFCDEFTMVDLELLHNLLEAVNHGSTVVFIGDYKQLPSVSPGNCFLDMLHSEYINVTTLDVVKRQGLESGLLKNANRIIAGQMVQSEKEIGDSFYLEAPDNNKILELTLKSVKRLLDKGFAFDEIQVLSPMRKTTIGTNYLNYTMQEAFNPKTSEHKEEVLANEFVIEEKIYKLFFRKNDKIIHKKNNSSLEWHDEYGQPLGDVYGINNGECGIIIDIYREKVKNEWHQYIKVQYEDGIIIYQDDFKEIEHAYALTIHKSQGSQWKAVIMPFSNSFYPMFQNNLIYTGWTRATDFGALIGQRQAIAQAINTFTVTERNSYLGERLVELKNAA